MNLQLALPPELSIFTVAQVASELRQALEKARLEQQTLELDGSAVTDFDGAGLQLMFSLQQSLAQGPDFALLSPSPLLAHHLQRFALNLPTRA
jgi:anti-anti-sigma regulatory factor